MTNTEVPEEVAPLVIQLMQQSMEDLAWTNTRLIDNLTAEVDDLRARNAAICDQIEVLLSGPWMPTPNAIQKALWPSDELVDTYRPAKDS